MFLILFIVIQLICTPVFAFSHVHGYFHKNGTHVKSHYRTSPDSTKNDNWSHSGNVNPYTGKKGYKK